MTANISNSGAASFDDPQSWDLSAQPILNLSSEQQKVLEAALNRAGAIADSALGAEVPGREPAVAVLAAALIPFVMQAHIENTRIARAEALRREQEEFANKIKKDYPQQMNQVTAAYPPGYYGEHRSF